MSEWKKYKLGDCIETVIDNRGKNPPLSNAGYELIETASISSNSKYPDFNKVSKFVSEDIYKNWFRKGHPKKGDILISTVGSIGNVAIINENRGCIAQNLIGIRTKEYILHSDYLYYFLTQKSVKDILLSLNIGSVQPSIKVPHLLNIEIEIPTLKKQSEIVNILSILDDKIQLNTQTNQTLEQIAQAIYKSWFVDYEPTRAKAAVLAAGGNKEEAETAAMTAISGKTAAALAALKQQHPARYQQLADLAAAFPAALVPADDFGEIPEGWEVKKVGEIAKITKGKKPKNVYPSQESNLLPHILVAALEGKYTEFCETTKMTVSKITNTLILMDGSASGKIAIGHHGVVGSTLAKMELFDNKYWAVLYHFLKSKEKDIQDNTTGTSIPHADKARINDYSLSICDGYILDFYNQFFKKSLFQSIENRRQSYLLESIRDTLLPKLLSGELKQE